MKDIEKKAREIAIEIEKRSSFLSGFGKEEVVIEEMMDAALEMANWVLSNQWVSVDDELPEKLEGEIVSNYVYVTNGNWYDIMRYEFNEKIWLDYSNGRHWGITHWMSIPKLNKD